MLLNHLGAARLLSFHFYCKFHYGSKTSRKFTDRLRAACEHLLLANQLAPLPEPPQS